MIEKNIFNIVDNKIVLRIKGRICETSEELFTSHFFKDFLYVAVEKLRRNDSPLLSIFGKKDVTDDDLNSLVKVFNLLTKMPADFVVKVDPDSARFFRDKSLLNDFVEYLYNYWRSFDRFTICDSEGDRLDKRPYRTFNDTIETLTHLIRKVYRDIQELSLIHI